MSTTVNDTQAQPVNTCAEIAANLRQLADRIETLNWHDEQPYFRISWLPTHGGDPYDQVVARVEAVSQAIFGGPASTNRVVSDHGTHRIGADGRIGRLDLSVHATVTPPEEKSKDEELAELKGRLAEAERLLDEATAPAAAETPADDPDDMVLQAAADELRDDLTAREAAVVARAEPDDVVVAEVMAGPGGHLSPAARQALTAEIAADRDWSLVHAPTVLLVAALDGLTVQDLQAVQQLARHLDEAAKVGLRKLGRPTSQVEWTIETDDPAVTA